MAAAPVAPAPAAGAPRFVLTPPPWRKLLAWVLLLNTGVAIVLWLLVPAMGPFWPTWVRSQCIGLAITSIAMGIGYLPITRRVAGVGAVMLMLLPAAPLGYMLGMQLASVLLGYHVSLSGTTALGAVIATVLASGLAGLVLWGRQRLRGEELAREQAQRLAAEAELRLLRAQLEPHMLFNTLANLRELMAEDPQAAQRMLDSFIVFLRGALAASRSERTTLAEEFAQLRAYLELMGVRMGERLAWRLTLPDELAGTALPPMLLQPLVENAIKHGLEPQVGPGSIEVTAERANGAVTITVTDTGRGLRASAAAAAETLGAPGAPPVASAPATTATVTATDAALAGGNYGVHHVRERLRAAFGPGATLHLQPHSPHGVRAIVRIPA